MLPKRPLSIISIAILITAITFGQDTRDRVNGNLIQFNDNGAWCWYQDEQYFAVGKCLFTQNHLCFLGGLKHVTPEWITLYNRGKE
jgi:hypothetical protein